METTKLNDYRWLASDDAEPYLAQAAAGERSTVALIKSLRQGLSPSRTRLVAAQIELRERAKQKFADADKMLFTQKLLEQATDQRSARYKASRFPSARTPSICVVAWEATSWRWRITAQVWGSTSIRSRHCWQTRIASVWNV